ncbi:MAG: hypothetical protein GWO08_07755, partial [Gammaproteobacteria bacterium]|nr:hypothetical protein [Gammaproteobacteria bacterium]NIR93559.1 hypothetical protein [Gammaproteobacteria bacterium]NIW45001.1 hypothetical protein [Gammaproteobacteria bacterium]
NKSNFFIWLLILLGLFFLVGCGQTTTIDPNELSIVDEEVVAPEVVEEEDQAEAGDEVDPDTEEVFDDELGAEEVTEDVADQPQEPNQCLDCHNDQQMLTDTAKPEEEVIVESEGEG